MSLSPQSSLRELMQHPLGRDIVDQLRRMLGAPEWALQAAGGIRLHTLDRLASGITGGGIIPALVSMCNQVDGQVSFEGPMKDPWWREAVFYQIYPRSFSDSNGDGIGDLRGIIERLDVLADLGVDCLWLSPIYASPNHDMGYDISDYRAIMPEMGTLADADELIAGCHERGMRIIMDLVVNHTSSEHEWFRRALADPDGEYGKYYFLVDGEPDTPPNNWQSFFSGPAWTWLPEQRKWYLHLFDEHQPDLNWANPAVRQEVAHLVRWWLDRGIDGFRMDVINYISKPGPSSDPRTPFPDGHPYVGEVLDYTGIEHYLYGPHLDEYLAELRREGFTRPDGTTAVMVGETPGIGMHSGRLLSAWSRKELDLIFNFNALESPGRMRWDDYRFPLPYLAEFWTRYNASIGEGDWVALFVENHDNPRMVSKVCPEAADDPALRRQIAKLIATMQLTMRGTPFIYQGQELGCTNEPFRSREDLRDVESLNRLDMLTARGVGENEAWEQILAGSRDHARTPVRWSEGQDQSEAWLPGLEQEPGFSVEAQRSDPDSVWMHYHELLSLRRAHSALRTGRLEVLHQSNGVCTYVRRDDESAWLIELSLDGRSHRRPAFTQPVAPVIGDRSQTMAPWSWTVSRIVDAK